LPRAPGTALVIVLIVAVGSLTLPTNGSAASASTSPAWAAALGRGVVLEAPTPTVPSNSRPAAAAEGVLFALAAGEIGKSCRYLEPALHAGCERNADVKMTYTEVITGFNIGYVAVDGPRALVGFTGTFCISDEKPRCMTNRYSAAILSSGKSFARLWSESIAAESNPANVYSLNPCVEVGLKWYFYLSPNAG
jgi:hypothetical protein